MNSFALADVVETAKRECMDMSVSTHCSLFEEAPIHMVNIELTRTVPCDNDSADEATETLFSLSGYVIPEEDSFPENCTSLDYCDSVDGDLYAAMSILRDEDGNYANEIANIIGLPADYGYYQKCCVFTQIKAHGPEFFDGFLALFPYYIEMLPLCSSDIVGILVSKEELKTLSLSDFVKNGWFCKRVDDNCSLFYKLII